MKTLEGRAKIYLMCTAIIWGLGFIGVQGALDAGWMPFPLLFMRGFIGALFLLPFTLKTKWWKNYELLKIGGFTGVMYFLGFAFQTIGQQSSTVANSAFLTALNVLFVPLLLRMFFHKKLEKRVYVGAMFACIGTAVLSLTASFTIMNGDILLICGAFFFALQIIFAHRAARLGDAIAITVIQLFMMAICAGICMPVTQQMSIPTNGWGSVLFVAIFSSAFAFLLQMKGQTHVSASTATILLSQEATIGTLASVVLLGQPLTIKIILGGCLMIMAVFISEGTFEKKPKNT